ncbi:MAG: DUF1836 domain-containing protein [Ruminococcus sp.]|nr:DUF1836 domain-containing protein [Ruminococcus sp.]
MLKTIPGTAITYSEQGRYTAFSLIAPVLDATGGLTLSQLSKLTGLEGSTIQNWIKRGWVSSPKSKKYSEKQVIRIILINMLKGIMKLEQIANLMTFINGDVDDTSDDIVDDVTLYNILCRIIFTAVDEGAFEPNHIRELIEKELVECASEINFGADKLSKAVYIMVMAYRSSCLKNEMEKGLAEINLL